MTVTMAQMNALGQQLVRLRTAAGFAPSATVTPRKTAAAPSARNAPPPIRGLILANFVPLQLRRLSLALGVQMVEL